MFYRIFCQPLPLLSGLVLSASITIISNVSNVIKSVISDTEKDPGSCTRQRLGFQMFGGEIFYLSN